MGEKTNDKGALMYCYRDKHGKVEAVLGFKRDALVYDISNVAFVEGHVMETDNLHRQHMVQDVGEEGNVDRVTRMLDLTIAKAREMLYPYTKHEISDHELDDALKEQSAYGIVLSLPDGFSQTTLNLLVQLIHEYIVCYTTADWMSITNPAKQGVWAEKAEDAERDIRVALHSRVNGHRRESCVF